MEALFNLLFGLQQDYGINEEELEEMVILSNQLSLLKFYPNINTYTD